MTPGIENIEFNGIEALRLTAASGATAVVSRFGAQVLSWVTRDGRERLFLSERARFDGGVPVRGGIPVCFPQFSTLGSLPRHGFVRTRPWSVGTRNCADDYAVLSLEIIDDESSRAAWPHAFRAEVTVALEDDRLDVELSVDNTGPDTFDFTAALHTYLRVVEVEDVSLAGLYGFQYRDAADGNQVRRETGTELTIDRETDRIYHDVSRPLLLNAGNYSLGIDQEGFSDVVVWNPWVEHCARLPDMAPSGFRHMLCVEAAAAQRPVRLESGENWYGRQSLVVI